MKITKAEVCYVAELSHLTLTESELEKLARDLDQILTYVDKLNELDTSQVEPMAQVLFEAEETATLREDAERKGVTNAEATANAPLSGAGYFKVPKVIER